MVLTESLIFRTHNSANSWENDGCFPDLRFLHITRTVLTCLLRFCEARNVKTSGELVGVDTLLLDGQVVLPVSLLCLRSLLRRRILASD